ncbi:uncharacterized protein LOC144313073 isoform X1 [Canis aureus]
MMVLAMERTTDERQGKKKVSEKEMRRRLPSLAWDRVLPTSLLLSMLEFIGLERRYTDGQQTHGKMFIITYQQGNANQNYSELSPHTFQNGLNQYKNQQVLARMWRKRNTCTPLMRVQTGAATMENRQTAITCCQIRLPEDTVSYNLNVHGGMLDNPRGVAFWKITCL